MRKNQIAHSAIFKFSLLSSKFVQPTQSLDTDVTGIMEVIGAGQK